MIQQFNYIKNKALLSYFFAFLAVVLLFFSYTSPLLWQVWGITEFVLFFVLSNSLSKRWLLLPAQTYKRKLFFTTFFISALYVTITFFLYINLRGEPFEYDPSDGVGYHESAVWYIQSLQNGDTNGFYYWWRSMAFDDRGYVLYLSYLYAIIGDNIFLTRIIKCLYHAFLCVLIYRLGSRHFGEHVGRMAAIFCMLLPNFTFYAASHRKEAEMIMLTVWCIERADYMMHKNNLRGKDMFFPFLLVIALFSLRTVLGLAAIFAIFIAILFGDKTTISRKNRTALIVISSILILSFSGGMIANQIENIYQAKINNQQGKDMEWRSQGNSLARYASAAVFAPMIFAIPFPTMVDVSEQYNQQRLNGAYFIKNLLAFFAMAAYFFAYKRKIIKRHLIILTFTLTYLMIIALSNFAHSERFHLPALPFIMLLAAFGISQATPKTMRWFTRYAFIMGIIAILWNAFKLSGRGLI